MATSSVDDTVANTSDSVFEMFCESCKKDNIYSTAHGFCVNCVEYFCEKCQRFHDRFLPNHVYKDQLSMPQDFCLDTCETHSTYVIKFYCENCKYFACSVCKNVLHKHCLDVMHVPSIVADIENSPDFKSFKSKLERNENKLKELTDIMLATKQNDIDNNFENAKACIKAQNKEMCERFECFKDEIVRKLDHLRTNDTHQIDDLLKEYKIFFSKCESLRRKIEIMSANGQRSKLFITMKRSGNDMGMFQEAIDSIESRCKVKKCVYEPNKYFLSNIECCDDIGSLKEEDDKLVVSRQQSPKMLCRSNIDLCMDVFQKNGISETGAELNRELNAWKAECINIAVIGLCGAGKSTFINSMCELKPGDPYAAKTGVIETTPTVDPYPLQRNTNVVLWEFPGFDARQIQPQMHYAAKEFKKMDIVIIIISSSSFLPEKYLQLINTVAQQGKVYYLVHTKFDQDLKYLRRKNCSESETKLLKSKLKSSYMAALKGENEVFFIDSQMLDSHDYERFEQVLISDAKCLSEERSISFTLALPMITEYAKTVKRELLEKRLPKRALQAALSLPLSKNIALLLKEEEDIYRQQFSKLTDVTHTSCTDVSYITNGIIDLKGSLFHKRVHAAKYELFKEQDKLTERFLPLFDIVESYELCFVWLQRCLENVLKSKKEN